MEEAVGFQPIAHGVGEAGQLDAVGAHDANAAELQALHEIGFGFEIEFVAKCQKIGARIYEVPISYYGRTYEEGKKIGLKDGLAAIWYLIKFNILTGQRQSFRQQFLQAKAQAEGMGRSNSVQSVRAAWQPATGLSMRLPLFL